VDQLEKALREVPDISTAGGPMIWARWQAFVRSLPSRILGSHVEINREQPMHLSSWAQFPADERLAARIKAQRELIGPREVRADRKLILENPDTFKKPIDFDEWYGPV
jgi:hypothetical protein